MLILNGQIQNRPSAGLILDGGIQFPDPTGLILNGVNKSMQSDYALYLQPPSLRDFVSRKTLTEGSGVYIAAGVSTNYPLLNTALTGEGKWELTGAFPTLSDDWTVVGSGANKLLWYDYFEETFILEDGTNSFSYPYAYTDGAAFTIEIWYAGGDDDKMRVAMWAQRAASNEVAEPAELPTGGGSTYYVRADGAAENKAAATGPTSDVSKCMSMAVFNSETFSPGDIIYVSGLGGSYTSTESINSVDACMHIESSGDATKAILVSGITGDLPLIDMRGIASRGISIYGQDYIVLKNIQVHGNGDLGCLDFSGASGASDAGYTVQVHNVDVLSNTTTVTGGDGFDLRAGAQADYFDCTATSCSSTDNGSDQCVSFHDTSKGRVFRGTFTNSNYFYAGTDTADLYATDITASGMSIETIAGSGTMLVRDSTIAVDNTGGLCSANAGSDVVIDACSIVCSAGKINYVRGALEIKNCSIAMLTGAIQAIYGFGGPLTFTGNNVMLQAQNSSFLRAEAVGGAMDIINNIFAGSVTNKRMIIFKGDGGSVVNNIFKDINSYYEAVWIYDDNGADVNIIGNTVINSTSGGEFVDCDYDGDEATTVTLKNNIFVNVANCSIGTVACDYNCYYSSSDEGGVNSITSDPLLNSDGTLQIASPCIDAGVSIAGVNDGGELDPWGFPVNGAAPNIGASQEYGFQDYDGAFALDTDVTIDDGVGLLKIYKTFTEWE